jgi:hypothetical protein
MHSSAHVATEEGGLREHVKGSSMRRKNPVNRRSFIITQVVNRRSFIITQVVNRAPPLQLLRETPRDSVNISSGIAICDKDVYRLAHVLSIVACDYC